MWTPSSARWPKGPASRTPSPCPAERPRSHLALLLAGVERGDEVLVPSFTFIASAAAVTYVGAHPVFVDCSADSWNLDPNLVEEALTERAAVGRLPAAVITVDLYGETADYEALDIALPAVRCTAHRRLGRGPRGRRIGAAPRASFGVAGVFSFNGNKIITTSGGGMLVTGSARLCRASPPSGDPSQGAVLPLRAHRRGVQLSPFQPACCRRQGAASRSRQPHRAQATDRCGIPGRTCRSPRGLADAAHCPGHLQLLADLHPDRSRGLRGGP